jgi:alpha-1,3-mannosyltransferase
MGSNSLRIVHVVRQYHPSCGGLEDVVRNLVLAQKSEGKNVRVVTLDTNFQNNEKLDSIATVDDVPVRRLQFVGSRRYSIAPSVREHIADADVVHIHAIDFFVDYISMLKRLGSLKARLIVSTHGGIFHTRSQIWLKKLFFHSVTPFSLSRVSAVIASSYADKAMFDPIVRDVTVIENGIRLRKFGAAVRSAERNGFLCLGRFSENKNLVNLVRWFSAAYRKDNSLHLYIAGRADTGASEKVVAAVRELGSDAAISVIPDPSDAAICNAIAQSRFVVSASTYEGFGLTVPELMSYGLVPVLSNIASFRHFITRAGFGELFDFNEESFVAATTQAINAYSSQQVERAERFAALYSWDTVARQFAAVYDA